MEEGTITPGEEPAEVIEIPSNGLPPNDFRPASYTDVGDPIGATIQDVVGDYRRRMIARVLGTPPAGRPEELPADFTDPHLLPENRAVIALSNRPIMAGEYLPPYLPGEHEIARLVIDGPIPTVIAIRARWRRGRYYYRMVGENRDQWKLRRRSSVRTLTLGQVVSLIEMPTADDHGEPLPILLRNGSPHEPGSIEWLRFVRVESVVYPGLDAVCQARAHGWSGGAD